MSDTAGAGHLSLAHSPHARHAPPIGADVLGKGYQRPLELATLRLFNMNLVLSHCEWDGQHQVPLPRLSPAGRSNRVGAGLTDGAQALRPCIVGGPALMARDTPDIRPPPAGPPAGKELAPERESLLTQQGGALVFDGQQTVFRSGPPASFVAGLLAFGLLPLLPLPLLLPSLQCCRCRRRRRCSRCT